MKIAIDQIQIGEEIRIRKETGDLGPLEKSISELGLINPILIDEYYNLVAGYRRLCACKNLGWQEVDVRQVSFEGDPLKILEAEIAENIFRKDFTPEEELATEARRKELVEKMRKKGVFERFWLWLKSLFQ